MIKEVKEKKKRKTKEKKRTFCKRDCIADFSRSFSFAVAQRTTCLNEASNCLTTGSSSMIFFPQRNIINALHDRMLAVLV